MSLDQLAKDLGLSKSTVSRALNGYSDVAVNTRARIQARANEINYAPNAIAARLKRGRSQAIGVVLPPPKCNDYYVEPFYSKLLSALAPELEAGGFQLLVSTQPASSADDDVDSYRRMIQMGWVDALLFVRTHVHDRRVAYAVQQSVPFITFGRTECPVPYAWADADNEQALYLATRLQIDLGHHRIAFLNAAPCYNYARLRQVGYARAMAEAGLPVHPPWLRQGGIGEQDGYTLCRDLLALQPRPTALVCTADGMAIGAMACCRDHGLLPGRDLSIIGYGNHPAAQYTTPPLTSIDPSPHLIGQQMGRYLVQRLTNQPSALLQHIEPVHMVLRDSHTQHPATAGT